MRYGNQEATSVSPDGEIGWSDTALELEVMHQSGDSGSELIDSMGITHNPGCLTSP